MKKLLSLFALIMVSMASFAATQISITMANFNQSTNDWSFFGVDQVAGCAITLKGNGTMTPGTYTLAETNKPQLMDNCYNSFDMTALNCTITQAGDVTTAQGTFTANGQDYEFIMTTASSTTSVDQIVASAPAKNVKRIENGRVVIMKNGVKYTTAGTVIK